MGYILNLISGIIGGVGYAATGYLASMKKEAFDPVKFLMTVIIGAFSGVSASVIGVSTDPITIAAASAGATAGIQNVVKTMVSITPSSDPLTVKIQKREGPATQTIPNWDGNPLQTLYIEPSKNTYIATRKALSPDESETARQSNIARAYADGMMTADQVAGAGYDVNKLLPSYRIIWDAQAKQLAAIKAGMP